MVSNGRELVHARAMSWHTMVVSNGTRHIMFIWFHGPLVVLLYCNRIDIVQCGWMMGRDLYALCRHAESMGETRYY